MSDNQASFTEDLGPVSTLSNQTQARRVEAGVDEALDAAAQLQAAEGRSPRGRELALLITKLDEAKLWLGEYNRQKGH